MQNLFFKELFLLEIYTNYIIFSFYDCEQIFYSQNCMIYKINILMP
jgi:hypothetical protein